MKTKILIVDDEKEFTKIVKAYISEQDREILIASCAKQARVILENNVINVMLLDLMLPDVEGLQFYEEIKDIFPDLLVIMLTASRSIPQVIKAIQLGVYHYITKPFKKEEIESVVSNAVEKIALSKQLLKLEAERGNLNKPFLIGNSDEIYDIDNYVERLRNIPFSCILLTGETGTGKSNLAKYIHWKIYDEMSKFVHLSCADISPNLLETELFGYEKGAFTDAKTRKKGLFEIGIGGTLFLDEIDSIQAELQKKLLYFLDNKKIRRVGSTKETPVDVRLIVATNANLEKLVEEKKFRKDLYYRLKVMQYRLSPLRERKKDIPLLANYFKDLFNITFSKNIVGITKDGLEKLKSYNWPGNIRELKNVMENAMIFCDGSKLCADDFAINPQKKDNVKKHNYFLPASVDEILPYEEMGAEYIRHVLKLTGNNKTKAAELLEISRTTLRTKLDNE